MPIEEIGEQTVRLAEEADGRREARRAEAAVSAGVGFARPRRQPRRIAVPQFGTAQVDYIYEQPPEELFRALLPKYVEHSDFPRAAGVGGRRTRRSHDRHGFGHQQRRRT